MNRLLTLWHDPGIKGNDLEEATRGMASVWRNCVRDSDCRIPAPGDPWIADPAVRTRAREWSRAMVGVVDDTVSWMLGNEPDTAVLVDDEYDDIVTVGEIIDRIATATVMIDVWPPQSGPCPLISGLKTFGRRFDRLAADLNAGTEPQPRRRSTGLPPVPRPQRIQVFTVPLVPPLM
ncbi:hypothetical protein [Nocardia sp. NPDC003963]